ncbi:MAG: hypothetical protein ACODAC_12335 [Pseudomonadota bacterium]
MTPPAVLERLPWRIAGVVALGLLVVVYQPELGGITHRLLIPVLMALATWLMVQNAAAVALGAGLLAAIHSEPGSADWVSALAYPALVAISVLVLGAVFVQRFRRRIAETHEARWRHRRSSGDGPRDRRP